MNSPVIALVDCNSFYCSCERIFKPALNNKPVVVLSNNDGCAISISPEAKKFDIKVGTPYFQFKHLCETHKIHVFSSNFSLYTDISKRVMSLLKKMAPSIDIYSVDEAFLDLTGVPNPVELCFQIKEALLRQIGIPVGIGIAPTKVMAKAANRIAKKSIKAKGVVSLLERKYQDIALKQIAVEDIWGIGRASSDKLKNIGIKTALDFRDYKNEKKIQSLLGKNGIELKHELMGITCLSFKRKMAAKAEIMCSRTFAKSTSELSVIKEALANYVTNAAEKLRRQNSVCQEISVFARTNYFQKSEQFYIHETKKLEAPTDDTFLLIKHAFELIEDKFQGRFEYKKVGISLGHFFNRNEYQLDIFSSHKSENKLNKLMDAINLKAGEVLIKSGACGINDVAFRMNRDFKSPRYTTSWSELPVFS